MYIVHLRLIRKLIVVFLFILIDLFLLGVTAEILLTNSLGHVTHFYILGPPLYLRND